jgi:hypothetical protein
MKRLLLRVKNRLMTIENEVLKRIFVTREMKEEKT